MKLGIAHITIFLLLGAIINIAGAWVCAAWSMNTTEQIIDHSFDSTKHHWDDLEVERILLADLGWSLHEANPKNRSKVYTAASTAFGMEYQNIRVDYNDGCMPMTSTLAYKRNAGWPCLALTGVELNHSNWNVAYMSKYWLIEAPFQIDRNFMSSNRYLPYRPIWPGFAINTLIYAALLWIITLGPFTIRQVIRHKRGTCLKCGYDLTHADHKVCPECGCRCTITAD